MPAEHGWLPQPADARAITQRAIAYVTIFFFKKEVWSKPSQDLLVPTGQRSTGSPTCLPPWACMYARIMRGCVLVICVCVSIICGCMLIICGCIFLCGVVCLLCGAECSHPAPALLAGCAQHIHAYQKPPPGAPGPATPCHCGGALRGMTLHRRFRV